MTSRLLHTPWLTLVAAVGLALPLSGVAQPLPKLLEAALASDPAVTAALAQVRAQEQRVVQAEAQFKPTVSLSGSLGATGYNERVPSSESRSFGTNQVALQITQPLWRTASGHGRDAARAQLEQAQAAVDQARLDAMQRLVDATFDTLKARDAVQLNQAQKVLTDEQLAAARRKFQLGAVPIPDVREAEARVDLVAAQTNASEQELELRLQVLAELTGTKPAELLQRGLQGDRLPVLPAASVLQWLGGASTQSAQVRQALRALEAAEAEIKRAEQGHMPTVDLTATALHYNDSGSPTSTNPRRADSTQVGVAVSVPLYAGGATQARVVETRALRDKAQADLVNLRRNISLQIRQAFSQALSAIGQARGLDAALRSAELAYQANKRGYEVGLKVTADVLDSQTRLFEVKRDLSRARYDAWAAFTRLKSVSGRIEALDFAELDGLLVAQAVPAAPAVQAPAPR